MKCRRFVIIGGGLAGASAARSLRKEGHQLTLKMWSRHSDLNRGPAVYETAALPLSYVGIGP